MHFILINSLGQNCRLCCLRSIKPSFLKLFLSKNSLKVGTRTMATTFTGSEDRFKGVTVDSTAETCPADEFPVKLQVSLQKWDEAQKHAIWFKVALEHSDWVPILAKNGFDFHHAKEGFVTMYKWLSKTVTNKVPNFAHTMIGVGGVVVNDKSELLVVKERNFLVPQWKLPGGFIETGENIIDGAIREVYEETHIHTEFDSILAFRQGHVGSFGCSDIYIVISLKPLSLNIERCEREIADAKWMKIDEYLNHPNIHDLNRFWITCYLEYKDKSLKIDCRHGIHQVLKKPYTVYFVAQKDS